MSHPYIGPLAAYNSLTDQHLSGYFNNTRIRRHLQRSGLITRSGRILSEKEYRINAMRRDHQKYIRECLAHAIFHKVIDMERHHQIDIKRKLETFARKERVQKMKVDLSKKPEEEPYPVFPPRPPTGPKCGHIRHMAIDGERSDSSESASSPRPKTAPGNIQRPVRLQPLQSYSTSGNAPKTSSGSRQKRSGYEQDQQLSTGGDKDIFKLINTVDHSTGISPYRLPILNNFVMPVPPPKRSPKQTMNTTCRGRRFRPTTAPNDVELSAQDAGKFHRTSLRSNVAIAMIYLGKSVHLSHDDTDYREDIKIFQQHCGGENLCIFKGRLLEGESFHFVSRRHRGFPFSLTFYINGIQVDRLSSCCEYKHRKGARLGGKNGYFRFINVEGASPCYRCIIAMGLDKKPSPPLKKTKEEEEHDDVQKEGSMMDEEVLEGKEKYDEEGVKGEQMTSETLSACGAKTDTSEDKTEMDYEGGEMEVKEDERVEDKTDEYEADDEARDEYDEDFEVDEEKPDEKLNEEGQVDDQVNGKSKSPSDDEKDDLDHEKKSNKASKTGPEAGDSEGDERDGHSDSDDGEEDKQDRKHHSASSSSSSTQFSSSSEDESENGNNEEKAKTRRVDGVEKRVDQEIPGESENHPILPRETGTEKQTHDEESANEKKQLQETGEVNEKETSLEEDAPKISAHGEDPQSHAIRDHRDTLCVSSSENSQRKECDVRVHSDESRTGAVDNIGIKLSEIEEEADCKSVQEKIAEAIGSDALLNPEPESSDTSTDEEDIFKSVYIKSKLLAEHTLLDPTTAGHASFKEAEEIVECKTKEQSLTEEEYIQSTEVVALEALAESHYLPDVSPNVEESHRNPMCDSLHELKNGTGNLHKQMLQEEVMAEEPLNVEMESQEELVNGHLKVLKEPGVETLEEMDVTDKTVTSESVKEVTKDFQKETTFETIREEIMKEGAKLNVTAEKVENAQLKREQVQIRDIHEDKGILEEKELAKLGYFGLEKGKESTHKVSACEVEELANLHEDAIIEAIETSTYSAFDSVWMSHMKETKPQLDEQNAEKGAVHTKADSEELERVTANQSTEVPLYSSLILESDTSSVDGPEQDKISGEGAIIEIKEGGLEDESNWTLKDEKSDVKERAAESMVEPQEILEDVPIESSNAAEEEAIVCLEADVVNEIRESFANNDPEMDDTVHSVGNGDKLSANSIKEELETSHNEDTYREDTCVKVSAEEEETQGMIRNDEEDTAPKSDVGAETKETGDGVSQGVEEATSDSVNAEMEKAYSSEVEESTSKAGSEKEEAVSNVGKDKAQSTENVDTAREEAVGSLEKGFEQETDNVGTESDEADGNVGKEEEIPTDDMYAEIEVGAAVVEKETEGPPGDEIKEKKDTPDDAGKEEEKFASGVEEKKETASKGEKEKGESEEKEVGDMGKKEREAADDVNTQMEYASSDVVQEEEEPSSEPGSEEIEASAVVSNEKEDISGDVSNEKEDASGDVSNKKEDASGDVSNEKEDASGDVSNEKEDASGDVSNEKEDASGDVSNEKEDASGDVSNEKEDVSGDVSNEKEDASGDVSNEKEDASGDVSNEKEDASGDVSNEKEDASGDVSNEKEDASGDEETRRENSVSQEQTVADGVLKVEDEAVDLSKEKDTEDVSENVGTYEIKEGVSDFETKDQNTVNVMSSGEQEVSNNMTAGEQEGGDGCGNVYSKGKSASSDTTPGIMGINNEGKGSDIGTEERELVGGVDTKEEHVVCFSIEEDKVCGKVTDAGILVFETDKQTGDTDAEVEDIASNVDIKEEDDRKTLDTAPKSINMDDVVTNHKETIREAVEELALHCKMAKDESINSEKEDGTQERTMEEVSESTPIEEMTADTANSAELDSAVVEGSVVEIREPNKDISLNDLVETPTTKEIVIRDVLTDSAANEQISEIRRETDLPHSDAKDTSTTSNEGMHQQTSMEDVSSI
ncbi:glutamate-rich protein 3 isoform X2 [Ascaphus truei]|uniref:glutamate-rich protein 3 isoform X2 n=1 Tax=Ascaphus truei TaxID=8439 RepID=UPI003F59D57C